MTSEAMARSDEAFGNRITENIMMRRFREVLATGLFPYYQAQTPDGLDEADVDGHKLIQLGSSNYLGLAHDPRVQRAAVDAITRFGTSCTSSRLFTGTLPLHETLELRLAQFLGKEAALAFTAGYLANIGIIPALVGRHDVVFFDAEVHACIIDGVRLSGADAIRFKHNDVTDLERKLIEHPAPRRLIAIDSLYSMIGDVAPLPAIVDVAENYGAWVFLDDAHGVGVLGPGGRGLAHACQVEARVPVIMGVFSKSFASTGGFIAGSAELIDYLRLNARSFVYSNALAPAQAAAALAALDILEAEPEIATRALSRADEARRQLRAMGWRCGGDGSQMVPVFIGDDTLTFRVTKALAEAGVVVSPAVYPAVPKGKDLLRVGFSPTLTEDQFVRALGAFERVIQRLPDNVDP